MTCAPTCSPKIDADSGATAPQRFARAGVQRTTTVIQTPYSLFYLYSTLYVNLVCYLCIEDSFTLIDFFFGGGGGDVSSETYIFYFSIVSIVGISKRRLPFGVFKANRHSIDPIYITYSPCTDI